MRNSAKSGGRTGRWLIILVAAFLASAALALELSMEFTVRAATPQVELSKRNVRAEQDLLPVLGQEAPPAQGVGAPPVRQSIPVALPVTQAPRIVPPAKIRFLVRDLAHDGTKWNAISAMGELRQIGDPALPDLQGALRSRDRQQRQLAGMILYRSVDEPSPELLMVAVEALEHDRLPSDSGSPDGSLRRAYTPVYNAGAARVFLARHPDKARPFLTQKLRSNDRQQRFLCASLLASGCNSEGQKLEDSIGLVVNVLSRHLRDNTIGGDATIALSALAHLGQGASPFLPWEFSRSDTQGRAFLGFLIQMIEEPSSEQSVIAARMRAHGLDSFVQIRPSLYTQGMVGNIPRFTDETAEIAAAAPH